MPQTNHKTQLLALIKIGHKRVDTFYKYVLPPICIFSFIFLYFTISENRFFGVFPRSNDQDRTIALILSIGFSVLSVFSFLEYFFKKKKDEKFIKIITEQPEKIAWVYKRITQSTTRHEAGIKVKQKFFHVLFFLKNKRKFELWLKEKQADQIMQLAPKLFPKAKIGYNKTFAQNFNKK